MPLHQPIFILGAHKSGTSLLRSLLDGHPDLFVIPFETHIFQMSGFWVDYRLRYNMPESLNCDEIKHNFVALLNQYNARSVSTADAQLQGRLHVERFQQYFDQDTETFVELIEQCFMAAYFSIYDSDLPASVRIAEKSVDHAEFALDLLDMFPDARFVHVVRNPYANLAAIRRSKTFFSGRRWIKKHYPVLAHFISSLKNSYYFLERNQRLIKNYTVIRYEDLLSAPEAVMHDVAQALNITWHDCLLRPTSIGDQWGGNSSQGIVYQGIDARNIDRWQADVKPLEIYCVNKLFPFLLDKYDYPRLEPARSHWLPNAREFPHIYLINRLITTML